MMKTTLTPTGDSTEEASATGELFLFSFFLGHKFKSFLPQRPRGQGTLNAFHDLLLLVVVVVVLVVPTKFKKFEFPATF